MSLIRNFSFRAFYVWRRNLEVNLITWKTNFLPPILEPILYIFAFGFGLGRFLQQIEYEGMTLSYIKFVAPGMISVAIFFHSFFECMYGSFVRMYYQKTFDGMISTPLMLEDVIAGEIAWGATKSLFAGGLMLIIISFFGLVHFPSALVLFPLAFVAGLLFASFGLFFCAICPSIETMNLPVFLISTPMFLFSGTFFPIEQFPGWFRIPVQILPLTHVVRIARAATLNHLELIGAGDILYTLALTIGFFLLSAHLMKRRLIK